jgi:hypothetical protein
MSYSLITAEFNLVNLMDVYTLTNKVVDTLNYILSKKVDCHTTSQIYTNSLEENESFEFKDLEDGEYLLEITQAAQTTNIKMLSYKGLAKSLMHDFSLSLCDNNCKGCQPDCVDQLTTYSKMLSYKVVNNPIYDKAVELLENELQCLISADALCLLTNETYKGSSDNELLFKRFMSLYYLAFYFTEINNTADNMDDEYVKNKYEYIDISRCISRLGINLTDINQLMTDNAADLVIDPTVFIITP